MKEGSIVKFRKPNPDEDPNHIYVVLEVFNRDSQQVKIQALNTGLSFPPVYLVDKDDLVISSVATQDLLGSTQRVLCDNKTIKTGKVISADRENIELDMSKGDSWVFTNVRLMIVDNQGNKHSGYLIV